MSDDYPAFEAPGALGRKEPRNWTEKEALAYFEWLCGNARQRVEFFLRSLELHWKDDSIRFLEDVSEQFERKLLEPQFRTPFGEAYPLYLPAGGYNTVLSPQGEAISADAGLLLGLLLLRHEPRLQWTIATDPDLVYFNRPVIVGFKGRVECEPVAVGRNIGGRIINARQRVPGRELTATYESWLDLIPDSGQAPCI